MGNKIFFLRQEGPPCETSFRTPLSSQTWDTPFEKMLDSHSSKKMSQFFSAILWRATNKSVSNQVEWASRDSVRIV